MGGLKKSIRMHECMRQQNASAAFGQPNETQRRETVIRSPPFLHKCTHMEVQLLLSPTPPAAEGVISVLIYHPLIPLQTKKLLRMPASSRPS